MSRLVTAIDTHMFVSRLVTTIETPMFVSRLVTAIDTPMCVSFRSNAFVGQVRLHCKFRSEIEIFNLFFSI